MIKSKVTLFISISRSLTSPLLISAAAKANNTWSEKCLHGINGFVIPTKSYVKIGIAKVLCYNNKMFSSVNKTFGCCSKIFGCSNKKKSICCPYFCCRNKTIFSVLILRRSPEKSFWWRGRCTGLLTHTPALPNLPAEDSNFAIRRHVAKTTASRQENMPAYWAFFTSRLIYVTFTS